jgi:hypothetical protein
MQRLRPNGCSVTVAGQRLRHDQVEKACEYKRCKLKIALKNKLKTIRNINILRIQDSLKKKKREPEGSA